MKALIRVILLALKRSEQVSASFEEAPRPEAPPQDPPPATEPEELGDWEWVRQGIGNRRRIVKGCRMYKNNWGEWEEA